jgi:ferric-dicitrate binding protein FerR (iron transport regulator)
MHNHDCPSQNQFWTLLSKKFSKEATLEDLQELQSILINNPDLHHHADLLNEMWQQQVPKNNMVDETVYVRHIMKHKDEFFVEDNSKDNDDDMPVFETNPGFLRTIFAKRNLIVFSILAVITLGVFYLFTQKDTPEVPIAQAISSVVTKNGNRTKIVLPDGSQVWLNAGSNLDYNNSVFNKDFREVSLNGEAYFDVTKNPEKPFIIHTKKMDIKVLGTAFNVRSYSNEKMAEASLIRGSIEITLKDRKDEKITLKPNEKISVSNEEPKTELKPDKIIPVKTKSLVPKVEVKELKPNPTNNIIPEIAWTQNKLYFEDENLEDISLRIERWFGKKVVIQNEILKNVRYTGNFEKENLETVLSSLKLSRSFNFKIQNDVVTIY